MKTRQKEVVEKKLAQHIYMLGETQTLNTLHVWVYVCTRYTFSVFTNLRYMFHYVLCPIVAHSVYVYIRHVFFFRFLSSFNVCFFGFNWVETHIWYIHFYHQMYNYIFYLHMRRHIVHVHCGNLIIFSTFTSARRSTNIRFDFEAIERQ